MSRKLKIALSALAILVTAYLGNGLYWKSRWYESRAENPAFEQGQRFDVRFASSRFEAFPWKLLAKDTSGDGALPVLADGKAFYYFFDTATDSIWFRFELYNSINLNYPSATLSLDVDCDQSTGKHWYGSNTDFVYDRMIFIGPKRKGDVYVGYNGVGKKKGVVAFYVDLRNDICCIGVKRSNIPPDLRKAT